MKKLILMCVTTVIGLTAYSQTPEKKWNIGFYGGITQYNGDRGMNFYHTDQPAVYGFAAVSFSRYLSDHFDASVFFTRGEVGNTEPRSEWSSEIDPNHFLVRMNTANLVLRFNLLAPRWAIRPYVYAGAGIIMHERIYGLHERFDYAMPSFGGGFNFRLNSTVSFQLEESFMYTTADNMDHDEGGGSNDGYLYHKAGLTFNLGKQKDADNDGVSDKKDKCGNTAPGVFVDAVGCPLDRDNDGVADHEDTCADIAGIASLKGCPDKDLDGITDTKDRFP